MQLLARYATWIQHGMAQRAQALEAAAAAAQQAPAAGGPQVQRQGAEQVLSKVVGEVFSASLVMGFISAQK